MKTTFALITAPASEPVSLADAKVHLRLEIDDDDSFVSSLITAAREAAEEYCWRGFVTQTWEFVSSCFPPSLGDRTFFELPRGQLVSVTSVKYIDENGVEQTLDPSSYSVDTFSVPGRVRLAYDESWPDARAQWDAVRIRYVVGTAAGAVPESVKSAIKLLLSQMYENRTPEISGTIVAKFDLSAQALLRPYRLTRL